ncbi:MAG: PKD domain-containing protein [Ginsengibacter sp.]
MKKNSLSGKWRQRPLLFRFLATLYFITCVGSLFSQTLNCDKTQCTSNDVRITSAYISGPGNIPIDCSSSDPFNNAELHLIVSSNTQRVGASVVANLNITSTNTVIPISYCFSGQNLNNGANNLSLPLGASLSGTQCPGGFTLSDQFISWGTGNTNFCTSTAGQCPATPSKCRYKPGETIPVTVKLDVDFTFTPGVCNEGGNSLAVDFSPVITATNLTAPFTYSWDFGDGTPTGSLTVSNLTDITDTIHTYAAAGNYTATLTISDASSTVITKAGVNSFTLTSCCNLTAPTVAAGPFCSADNKTVADLPQSDGNGGTYHWYSGSDPNNSYELDPSTKLVTGTIYVSVASGDCESPRTAVTIVVNQTPGAPTVTGPLCAGATTISGTSSEADGTTITIYNGASKIGTTTVNGGSWNATVTAVSAGDVITATATSSGCSSTASASVTVSDNTATPTVIAVCAGATTVTGTNETGATVEVFVNGISVGNATVTDGNWSKTVSALSAGDKITATATVSGKCASAVSAISIVNPLPDCTISSSGSPTSASLGSQVTFNAPNVSGSYSYAWALLNNTSGASFVGSATTSDASVTVKTTTVGSYTLTLTVTNTVTGCTSSSACSYRMTVTPTGPYYSVTQGFYGNIGGKVCMAGTYYTAGTKSSVPGLIETSISNMPNQKLVLGSTSKSFTMGNTATEASNLIKYMPGGQTPVKLAGIYNITTSLPPLYKGKIANVFLTQSITLALNVSIPNNTLSGFVLKSGYLTTQKINSATCPSTTLLSCSASNTAISSLQITTNSSLINWMNGKTVQDLLNLASAVLGGTAPPAGVSISDINNAIDVINRSFDGGAVFLGYYPTQKTCASSFNRDMNTATNAINTDESVNKLSVTAYPNPFTNKVKFSIESPVSGMASLDVYNIVGQKLKTVYQGYLQAGAKQIIEYNVPSPYKGALIYTLKVGDQQVNGKVVQMK